MSSQGNYVDLIECVVTKFYREGKKVIIEMQCSDETEAEILFADIATSYRENKTLELKPDSELKIMKRDTYDR